MRWYWKSWPAIIVSSPALTIPLPANRYPSKLAPKVSNEIPINPTLCPFSSFLILKI